ncbi:MAG: undecaprenyl-phosphate glucose phosphotransferase [Deltaproteobacteria bacterium]|nr:undecaprenyl-phosphate glucose phosphotransferase [Deltaproteobacteria bacterium]
MLKKNAQLFEGLFAATDLAFISFAWLFSYWVRFQSGFIPVDKGVPLIGDYLKVLIFVWIIWAFVFRRFGLYRPMRGTARLREIWMVVKANSFSILIFLAVTYLFREKSVPFSRLVFGIFWFVSTVSLVGSRTLIRQALRTMRRRGYNIRYVIVVGAGELAAKVVKRLRQQPEYGLDILGCLSGDPMYAMSRNGGGVTRRVDTDPVQIPLAIGAQAGAHARRTAYKEALFEFPRKSVMVRPEGEKAVPLKIIGHYNDLYRFIEHGSVDSIIVALPLSDQERLEEIVEVVGDSMIDVKIIPDYYRFVRLGSLVEEFDGMPVVSVSSTPLVGVNRITKRVLDVVLGTLFSLIAVPIMALAALAVKINSRGPIFYSQERVGLDGQRFHIYKFRTMAVDAEKEGAKFAVAGDPRVTFVGKILRRLSIDELPQLLNVIRGQMSLVGPRPERPVFIEDFRKQIPRYMLRHKVQSGMTGWAQVNGWRGNTSIERRIEHDLYYIENWSLALDLKILFKTIVHGLISRNAY